ncbi:MAG: putative metalloprotease with PDZ domain [Flammeovirgaceae bacterium]
MKIQLFPPAISTETAEYVMPSVIPGSYSKKDYGRFIERFRAYDNKGKRLRVRELTSNVFQIQNAQELNKIEYYINDTWDANTASNYIFQPGGTNIDEGKNVVINHHGFYGYLEGHKMLPYRLEITKPTQFFGATPLQRVNSENWKDVFTAPDYVKLADNPIMYSQPDTAIFWVGETKVTVAVHSETGIVKASSIREMLRPLSKGLEDFFEIMPVEEYQFLMYFPNMKPTNPVIGNWGFGALEHSYCSFYFLPEMSDQTELQDLVLGVASHEFLHILTPLNIHSQEIRNFDFRNPKMSQHLWLYEGVTEYFSNLVQLKAGLMDKVWFMDEMHQKIKAEKEFPQVSFTEMSRRIIEPKYQNMYGNVYDKGAMISMLLDIRLNELSDGAMNLRSVMLELSKKYGPEKAFEDSRLIPEIVEMTFPEISDFFHDYVIGNQPLPYGKYFAKMGWEYLPQAEVNTYSYGDFKFAFEPKKRFFYVLETDENVFGWKANDVIFAVNEERITESNANSILGKLIDANYNDSYTIQFVRNGENKKIVANPKNSPYQEKHVIQESKNPTAQQIKMRMDVLGGNAL